MGKTKYPPDGCRSFGYCAANNFGDYFDEYIKKANDDIVVIAQIEHIDALNSLSDILCVDGLDGTFIGPLDLKGSVDINMDDVIFNRMLDKYRVTCENCNKTMGMHIVEPSLKNINQAKQDGYKMLAIGTDGIFLNSMSKKVVNHVFNNS